MRKSFRKIEEETLPPIQAESPEPDAASDDPAALLDPEALWQPPRKRRVWLWLLVACLLIAAGGTLAYVYQEPLLRGLGNGLVHEPFLQRSDVIAILGGGGIDRAERGVELYHQGWAPRILVMLPQSTGSEEPYSDLVLMESMTIEALMDYHDVPQDAVNWSGQTFYSTYDEAVYLRAWMEENGYTDALVVSGWFQSARAHWSLQRLFPEERWQIETAPAPPFEYDVEQWWLHEDGLISVQNEYLKTGYYWLKALLGQY